MVQDLLTGGRQWPYRRRHAGSRTARPPRRRWPDGGCSEPGRAVIDCCRCRDRAEEALVRGIWRQFLAGELPLALARAAGTQGTIHVAADGPAAALAVELAVDLAARRAPRPSRD